jgi:hypothetical protein
MDSNVNNNTTTTTSNVLQQNNYQYNLYSPFYSQNYYYNTNNENIAPTTITDQQTYNNYPYYNNYQSYYNNYPATYLNQAQDEPVRTNTPDKPIMNDSGVGVSPDVVSQQAQQQESDDEDFSNASSHEQIVKKSSNSKSSSNNSSLMKPPKPYLEIIADAILTTSDHMMQLHEIYQYMESKFAYFAQNVNKSWRNSVRHNLSLNECFVKAGRGSNGKGNFWKIHGACEQDFIRGNFRRKNFKILIRQSSSNSKQQPQQNQHHTSPAQQSSTNPFNSLNYFNSQLQSFGIENFLNSNNLVSYTTAPIVENSQRPTMSNNRYRPY